MGIICRLIGSRISHTAEAIQRHRSISKGSISPTAPGTPVKYITAGNDEYIVTNREAAHTLVQGGYAGYAELPPTAPAHFECAELPNSTVHHECSELPAVPIHEAYAELPASGPPEKSAELPGTPCQASTTQRTVLKEKQKEESFKSEIGSNGHGDLHYSDRLHHGIEPNVAFDQRDVTAHGSGLPTYSESEFTPAARFDAPTIHQVEEFNDQQSGNTARVPVQMTAPGSGPGYSFQRLAHPVILPQQKPGVVDEGFVRAYAPELADCGINQEMFMSFHEDLFQTSMSSRSIEAVSIAAGIVGNVPETASLITGMVAQIAAGTACEVICRRGACSFFDRVNYGFFLPRGLYAMVITFKDSIPGPQDGRLGYLSQKLGRTIFAAEKIDFDLPGATNTSEGIRPGSRNADSQLGLPQASPLVYPEVDLPMTKQLKEEGMNKKGGASQRLKVAGNWVQGYMEKRALESQQQQCLVVRRGFSQRGPGHPEDNGKLLAALTSGGRPGHKNLIQRTAGFIKDAQALKRSLDSSRDSTRSQPQDQKTTEPSGNGPQQGMQHLCVVNLPTEEELRQSVALLDLLLQQTGQCSPHY